MKGSYLILHSVKPLYYNSKAQLAHFVHKDYIKTLIENGDVFRIVSYDDGYRIYQKSLRSLWVDLCIRYKKYNSDPVIMKEHARLLATKLTSEYIERENTEPVPQCQFCTRLGKCLFCSGYYEWPI